MLALVDADILLYRIGYKTQEESDDTAKATLDRYIEEVVWLAGAWDYKLYLTDSKGNFRNAIYPEYKQNRVQPKPLHYNALKEHLILQHSAIVAEGQEADDALGIEQCSLEDTSIICSIDKDLLMIPGWNYNFVSGAKVYIKPEEGLRRFYKQILTGDTVDNIPGLKGIGPKKADLILKDCINEQELKDACIEAYKGKYPDSSEEEIRELVQRNGRLLWIRRESGQLWNL